MKLKLFIFIVIAFTLYCSIICNNAQSKTDSSTSTNTEEAVIEITPKSFYDQIKKYGRLLLYFHSKKCSHCNKFSPIFDEIAKESKEANQGYGFVKIDGPENEEFADTFKMTETPSIYFVEKIEGHLLRTKYEGKRSKRAIKKYLTKKYSYRPRELTDYNAFKELVKKSKKFMIFFGDKEKNLNLLKKFISSALDNEIENIFWTKSNEFYEKYGINKGNVDVVIHFNKDSILDAGIKLNLPLNPNAKLNLY